MILRAALGMLFCLLVALPCLAQDQATIEVNGINVDVTSTDAVSAREKAVLTAQREALAKALTQVSAGSDVSGLPTLSDDQITDMVADYQVESEKVSSVRYIGQMTFRFRADAVNSYLRQNGINTAGSSGFENQGSAPTPTIEQHLTVDAIVGSLAQWSELNRRLAAVGAVHHVDVVYLMRGRAQLDLVFVGEKDEFAHALSQQALLLQDSPDGKSTLSLAGGAQP